MHKTLPKIEDTYNAASIYLNLSEISKFMVLLHFKMNANYLLRMDQEKAIYYIIKKLINENKFANFKTLVYNYKKYDETI